MANSNLFYQLYSKSDNTVAAPYICSSAVDENDTSFDVSGDKGIITDSNGKELASIDLTPIHADNITQYGVETQVLEPNGYYVLEGKYYGEAFASYAYEIPKIISDVIGYEKYVSLSFDIIYGNWKREFKHIRIIANASDDLDILINNTLQELKIPVNATIQTLPNLSGKNCEYLVFTAEQKKYFYYLRNLLLKVCFQSEDYINSPFNNLSTDDLKQIIIDNLNNFKPILAGHDEYEFDCVLYAWILKKYKGIKQDLYKFKYVLEQLANPDLTPEEIAELNKLLDYTAFSDDVIQKEYYTYEQLCVICNMLQSICDEVSEQSDYYPKQLWLQEDISKRITFIKYPNGAYKGIVIIPDYPKDEKFEYNSLYIHHIQDVITVFEKTHNNDVVCDNLHVIDNENEQENSEHVNTDLIDPVYRRKIYGVISNVDFAKENEHFSFNWKEHHPKCEAVDTLSCCYPEYFMDRSIAVGQHQQKVNNDIMSLTGYIDYLNANNLWTKFGHFYSAIGKNDDPQNHTKNYITSVLIHNPNNIPIRIKYLTFS